MQILKFRTKNHHQRKNGPRNGNNPKPNQNIRRGFEGLKMRGKREGGGVCGMKRNEPFEKTEISDRNLGVGRENLHGGKRGRERQMRHQIGVLGVFGAVGHKRQQPRAAKTVQRRRQKRYGKCYRGTG